ncbi:MAG: hypothetical protein HY047_00355 [Acidobacteria bacterium]|nr:hypothetical protein [Acidobacteriota bacterium]
MKYLNANTELEIDLSALNESERTFYRTALRKFMQNTPWLAFDAFAFGMMSALYRGRTSHLEVLKSPLYLALKDMSLQLGVQQGMIARKSREEKNLSERGQERRGRPAKKTHDRAKDRELATAR